jgi:(2S)-methylsuccinyl-CoA dehydrogenase
MSAALTVSDLLSKGREASHAVEVLLARATDSVRHRVSDQGRLSSVLLESEQRATHGLAWLATYAEAIRELVAWGERLAQDSRLTETEALIIGIGLGEYLAQIYGGIPMSQGEMIRLDDLDVAEADIEASRIEAVRVLIRLGNTAESRSLLIKQIRARQGAACVGDPGLDDTLESIRDEMRKFAAAEVEPFAQ